MDAETRAWQAAETRLRAVEQALQRLQAAVDELKLARGLAPAPDEWITLSGACKAMHVSKRTIYNWIGKGWVETRRTPSGNVRVSAASLWRRQDGRYDEKGVRWRPVVAAEPEEP